jgi:hypothetical protein
VSELDQQAFPVFAGRAVDNGDYIVVTGPTGELRIEGIPEELRAIQDLLRAMDGQTSMNSLLNSSGMAPADQAALLRAAGDIGAILDWGRAWHWFHKMSSNPPSVQSADDPMTAYDMPRLALNEDSPVIGDACPDPAWVDGLACERRSADLESTAVAPAASLRSAIRLAVNAYLPGVDGHRPAASGGALYPLHFWVIGAADATAPRDILGIDHDHGRIRQCGHISLAELRSMFVPDHALTSALDRGAAVIVIAADPRRVTRKYGNRGWRWALMECGAVMHHMTLAATSRKEAIRPIGSYYDVPLTEAVCGPALPLLTIVVAVQ